MTSVKLYFQLVSPVCVSSMGTVSTTRASCHIPAGLIRVQQSYVVLERSSTPQGAASTPQTPHSAVCAVSSALRGPLKRHCRASFFSFFGFICLFLQVMRLSQDQRLLSQSQDSSDISFYFISRSREGRRGTIAQNVLNFLIISLAACALMRGGLPLLCYCKGTI